MKFRSASTVAATALLLAGTGAQAALSLTIDLNARVAGAQQTVALDAGTYTFAVVSGTYDGWTYQSSSSNVREAFWVSTDGGSAAVSIDVPSLSNRFTSYASSADAIAAFSVASSYVAYAGKTDGVVAGSFPSRQFSFSAPVTLTFGIPDNLFTDNGGGVSLAITAVPEPQSAVLLLAGLGVVGFVARGRRRPG